MILPTSDAALPAFLIVHEDLVRAAIESTAQAFPWATDLACALMQIDGAVRATCAPNGPVLWRLLAALADSPCEIRGVSARALAALQEPRAVPTGGTVRARIVVLDHEGLWSVVEWLVRRPEDPRAPRRGRR